MDILSYIIGIKKGKANVELSDTEELTFTDTGNGDIVIAVNDSSNSSEDN